MDLVSLLQALVETEDQMARMSLVEENKDAWEGINPVTEGTENVEGEDWEAKYNELKQKYITTFFSGASPEDTATEEETTEDRSSTIKIDDVLKGE